MSLNRFTTMLILSFVFVGISAAAANRPNVLFILADDLSYGDVDCYYPEAPTTHLDALAKQGMRFTDAYSPSAVCMPTRYSLLTGRMAFRNGSRIVFTGVGGPCLIEADCILPGFLDTRFTAIHRLCR